LEEITMRHPDEVRRAIQDAKLNLDDDAVERLSRGEEVELTGDSAASADSAFARAAAGADEGDCCGAGWIGVGHRPRFCFKVASPPKFKICWG